MWVASFITPSQIPSSSHKEKEGDKDEGNVWVESGGSKEK